MSSIVLYVKVVRSSINSKKYLKMLGKKDTTWRYKNIEKQAIKTFYSIQKSWTNMDMSPSQEYMSKDLYEAFNIKLNFMEMQNKRNVLKMINLFDIKPVSVYDNEDDDKNGKPLSPGITHKFLQFSLHSALPSSVWTPEPASRMAS